MKQLLIITTLLFSISFCSFSQSIKGNIKLIAEDSDEDPPVIKGKSGSLEYSMTIQQRQFFGKPAIHANTPVKNSGTKKETICIALAFFNAAGNLIGATSQTSELNPGEETMLGSLLVYVKDSNTWKEVTAYQAVVYLY
jgi:hypothetical protein